LQQLSGTQQRCGPQQIDQANGTLLPIAKPARKQLSQHNDANADWQKDAAGQLYFTVTLSRQDGQEDNRP
jgi:hypothetical protein